VEIEKGYIGRRPQTIISLSKKGREMFKKYIKNMRELFDDLDE
jgi:putative heme iron utilization protein